MGKNNGQPRPPEKSSNRLGSWRMAAAAGGTALALASFGCTHTKTTQASDPSQAAAPAQQTWADKMQSLSRTLASLLPMVSDSRKFSHPDNFAKIEADTKRLKSLAHSLNNESRPPNQDPSMQMMTGLFEEDLQRAVDSLGRGQREYARHILRDTTSYCIQCHTQTNNGPNFPRLNLDIDLAQLTDLEKAEFFAATRQFDRAVPAFEKVIVDNEFAKNNYFEWDRAARAAMAILVKVQRDPDRALDIAEKIRKNTGAPASQQKVAQAWITDLKQWKREKKPLLLSPQEQLVVARRLVERAQKQQAFPLDHSQDIIYFRASALLHDLLSLHTERSERTAAALYYSGIAAESTRDMNFWTLHETYYQNCIRHSPRTETAQKCYKSLEDSVTLGYSGSSGTQIPPDVQKNLNESKRLAFGDPAAEKAAPAEKPAAPARAN